MFNTAAKVNKAPDARLVSSLSCLYLDNIVTALYAHIILTNEDVDSPLNVDINVNIIKHIHIPIIPFFIDFKVIKSANFIIFSSAFTKASFSFIFSPNNSSFIETSNSLLKLFNNE